MEHYHEGFQFSNQLLTVLKFILIIEAKTLLDLLILKLSTCYRGMDFLKLESTVPEC